MVKAISTGRQTAMTTDGNPGAFREVLKRELEQREIVNKMGDPNWVAFAELLDDYKYESLRKALVGDRQPTPGLMEACAAALGVDPTVFLEYRVWQAKRQFDPREVGMAEAIANLDAWAKLKKKQ